MVLRRPAGTSEPFKAAPDPPKAPRPRARPSAPPPKPKPDRKPLDAAEKALAAFDREAKRRRETLERDLGNERRALERQERAA